MTTHILPPSVAFGPVTIKIIDRNGRPWVTSADLARALGYSLPGSVNKIFERNKREFTDDLTLNVNLTSKGFGNGDSVKPTRIFSPRGCHLVAMFARTPDARAFRRWVLDVLEKLQQDTPPSLAHRRWLIQFDHAGRECVNEVPKDAMVLTTAEFLAALSDQLPIDSAMLAEFISAAGKRLAKRCESLRMRQPA